jgi:hypothetical protein
VLTGFGRLLLGLVDRHGERLAEKRAARARLYAAPKTTPPATAPKPPTEHQHIQALGSDGGGQGASPPTTTPDVGRECLRKIQSSF